MPKACRTTCNVCGLPRKLGSDRALCAIHITEYESQATLRSRVKLGRYNYPTVCRICHLEFSAASKDNSYCADCRRLHKPPVDTNYIFVDAHGTHRYPQHRLVVERILGVARLPTSLHIHHYNCNGRDNAPSNLVVLAQEAHNRLHRCLDSQYLLCIANFDDWLSVLSNTTETWLL